MTHPKKDGIREQGGGTDCSDVRKSVNGEVFLRIAANVTRREMDFNEAPAISPSVRLIVVSNRLPFVLKRNQDNGNLERKSRYLAIFIIHLHWKEARG